MIKVGAFLSIGTLMFASIAFSGRSILLTDEDTTQRELTKVHVNELSSIERLPSEVLRCFFPFLKTQEDRDNAKLTCKTFYEQLWKSCTYIGFKGCAMEGAPVLGLSTLPQVKICAAFAPGSVQGLLSFLPKLSGLRSLYLPEATLNATAIQTIASSFSSVLESLTLDKNKIDAQRMKTLAGERFPKNLKLISLGENPMGDDGGITLSQILSATLQELYLGRCQIGPTGMMAFAPKLGRNLQILHLQYNPLGPDGGKALAQVISSMSVLRELDLDETGLGDAAVNAMLRDLPSQLRLLLLGRNGLTDAIFDRVTTLPPTLAVLALHDNALKDEGLIQFVELAKGVPALEMINFSSNQIGSPGATAIAGLMRQNPRIKSVELDRNRIEDPGATELAKAVQMNAGFYAIENKRLLSLILEENPLTREGRTALRQAQKAVKDNGGVVCW